MPQSSRCYEAGKVLEDGLGQEIPQEPNEQLSHGVDTHVLNRPGLAVRSLLDAD